MRPRPFGDDPLPGPWTPGGPEVWLLRGADGTTGHEHVLDAGERARAAAFARAGHRERYVAAHVALRRLLGAYLGRAPEEVEFVREPCPCCGEPHGRPAVPGAPLHFNLSHAGDLALFAFADVPVGADVEQEPRASVVADVAGSLHPRETAELAALPEAERVRAFARCWTRKEAYLKGTGTGLAEALSVTYVGCGEQPASPDGWSLRDVEVGEGYTAALALAGV
ncbi:4'-phosphopantetheinyl transferase superfamily protein [Streptomyces sp. AV19]|uniref:4'-phosphopantetheinyl transferase family protein n=1 Tax=Streptomyces sp. AV19 TaxID=2793068 RepID=UPI0018FE15A9|nr:4'-phosphopantetheinyl transferase superfamily protein [Streptomyces sp. AV19]MBH1938263.1 4'-phosphopantetheinyl transferase superfamily protein [Streptomyces sp. AV19]MDG4534893.1 4'-phosphopantetheinyl transferase superfamily protein [Streptomyces sp. AV19]